MDTPGERDNEKIKKNIEEKIKEVKLYLNPVTAAGAVAYAKSSSGDENNYNKVGIAAAASYAYENMEKGRVLDTIYSLVGPDATRASTEANTKATAAEKVATESYDAAASAAARVKQQAAIAEEKAANADRVSYFGDCLLYTSPSPRDS